jgi:hypothetical protein
MPEPEMRPATFGRATAAKQKVLLGGLPQNAPQGRRQGDGYQRENSKTRGTMSKLLDQIATPVEPPKGALRAWIGNRTKRLTEGSSIVAIGPANQKEFPACATEYAPEKWSLGWGLGGFSKNTDSESEVAEWLG